MTERDTNPEDGVLPRHSSLWHMIAAPTVWAIHFALVYGWTALSCARWGGEGDARLGVVILTLVALALIAVLAWRAWRQWDYLTDYDYVHDKPTTEHRKEFLGHAGWLLAMLSAIGVLFVAAPAFYIRSCL